MHTRCTTKPCRRVCKQGLKRTFKRESSRIQLPLSRINQKTNMTTFNLNSYVQKTLKSYLVNFPKETERFTILQKQLTNWENIWSRKNFNGHMTACAYLINNGKCLKIHHIGLDKWLAPGGHREESMKCCRWILIPTTFLIAKKRMKMNIFIMTLDLFLS